MRGPDPIAQRFDSLRSRIRGLAGLDRIVAGAVLTERQRAAIDGSLRTIAGRLEQSLKRAVRDELTSAEGAGSRRRANAALGRVEVAAARAYTAFDTYADVLTQRLSPELGPMLAGCDVLAADALLRDHPALAILEPPIVYCDRGFGASVVREGIAMPGGGPNPLPLIQIPYARLRDKPNLVSLVHEAGHEAMARLALVPPLAKILEARLKSAGASDAVARGYASWASEIGPDFWAFCACGFAQTRCVIDVLSLPPETVLAVDTFDPHPPPVVRPLLSIAFCRRAWGAGPWDLWERRWLSLYPPASAASDVRSLLLDAIRFAPVVAEVLFAVPLGALGRRTIASLFDRDAVAPAKIARAVQGIDGGRIDLRRLRPCGQLAVFRHLSDAGLLSSDVLESVMMRWLCELARRAPRHTSLSSSRSSSRCCSAPIHSTGE